MSVFEGLCVISAAFLSWFCKDVCEAAVRVRIPPPPFDSLRSLMAGHSSDFRMIEGIVVKDLSGESDVPSLSRGNSMSEEL